MGKISQQGVAHEPHESGLGGTEVREKRSQFELRRGRARWLVRWRSPPSLASSLPRRVVLTMRRPLV